MERQWSRALLVSLIMILSSLAGCLDAEENTPEPVTIPGDNNTDNNTSDNEIVQIQPFGNVMVSTYHVGELVSAVAGEHVTIEYMSQNNIPVHDYEPSVADLIRLQESDLFFYHGLGLEPWAESTLSSLGTNAPPSYMTHAMPSGQVTLDYESMLISEICEHMSEGPYEATTLVMDDSNLPEIHAEHNVHTLSFPEMDDDHDGHNGTEEHDDQDDHDGHDGHDGHNHGTPEKVIENPVNCPTDTVISIFHLEEGVYILEFEAEEEDAFDMIALKMGGGHADHDHEGHDDHDDHEGEEDYCHNTITHENYDSNEIDCEAAGHVWMEVDDDHDDHNETDDHDDHDGHDDHDDYDFDEATPQEIIDLFDSNNDNHLSWDEFWTIWTDDDHDDHDDHNETDDHDDHNDEDSLRDLFNASDENGDQLLDLLELGHFIEELGRDHNEHKGHVGYVSIHIDQEGDYGFALPMDVEFHILMGEDDHDDHDDHDEGLCHDTTTHENVDLNEADCENAGHVWMEGEHEDDDHEDDDHDDESNNTIIAEDGEDISYDPHSWLDPLAFEAQLNIVLEKLILTFPDGTSNFTTNANSYKAQLQTLDDAYEDAFGVSGTCSVGGHEKTIVANHNAYSYISNRYNIEIITVHGLDPEGEPSPQDIIGVVEHIDEKGISVLFVEEYTSQNAVNSIVEDTGVSIEKLYTMEMAPIDSNDNYISMMTKNLNNLVNGIGC